MNEETRHGADDPADLARRSELEAALLAKRRRGRSDRSQSAMPRVPRTDPLRLSSAQYRLWFADAIAQEPGTNNVVHAERLRGPVIGETLASSIENVIRRHEVLRSRIAVVDGMPMCVPSDEMPRIEHVDASSVPLEERYGHARALTGERARQAFDLTAELPIRVTLCRYAPDDLLVVCVIHHISCDEWSIRQFLKQVAEAYQEWLTVGEGLGPLPVQYADFAAWQARWMESAAATVARDYWCALLDGAPRDVRLPFASNAAAGAPRGPSRQRAVRLDPGTVHALDNVGRALGATPFMTMLAATSAFLHRAGGQSDLAIASLAAGRSRPELENLVGMFTNTFVLRTRCGDDAAFPAILGQVRNQVLRAIQHQAYPFDAVLRELDVPSGGLPFLTVMFTHRERFPPLVVMDKVQGTVMDGRDTAAKFSLWISVIDDLEGRTVRLIADAARYDDAAIDRLQTEFRSFLERLAASPSQSLTLLQEPTGSGETIHARPVPYAPDAPLSETETRIADIWIATLDNCPSSPDVSFFDDGGDSLQLLHLVFRISQELGIELKMIDVFAEPTVRGLARLCEGSKGVLARQGLDAPGNEPVVALNRPGAAGRQRGVFYVISGAGGHVLPFAPMARRIEDRWHALGLPDPGFVEPDHDFQTVSDVAARHVERLEGVDPEGPYLLVGYSYGGYAAFEMARLLRSRGKRAGLVVLDTRVFEATTLRLLRRTLRRGGTLARRLRDGALAHLGASASKETVTEDALTRAERLRRAAMSRHQRKLVRRYRPVYDNVPVVVVRVRDGWRERDRDDYGWSRIGRVVAVFETAGNHFDLFKAPNEAEFVETLDQALTVLHADMTEPKRSLP